MCARRGVKVGQPNGSGGLTALPKVTPEVEKWRSWVSGRRFLWTVVPPWRNVWTRQQHFTLRLAALGGEIIYVESPESILGAARKRLWGRLAPLAKRHNPVSGIDVISLPATLPGSNASDSVANVVGYQAALHIKRELRRRGWAPGEYVCWNRIPLSRYVVPRLKPAVVTYDVTDDYAHFVKDPRRQRMVGRRDDEMTRLADLVMVTSPSLLERRRGLNPNSHTVLNGVDFELFNHAARDDLAPHPRLSSIPGPRIGYVGLIEHWVDMELIEKMAARWPGQVVIVGPIAPALRARAGQIGNAIWTGFIDDRAELPSFIKGFDVVTMPFQVNELTNHMNPLKIWEYLATGKPFVATNLDSLELCQGVVDVAHSHEEFLDLGGARLDETDGKEEARIEVAMRHSWDVLFDRAMQLLSQTLERGRR